MRAPSLSPRLVSFLSLSPPHSAFSFLSSPSPAQPHLSHLIPCSMLSFPSPLSLSLFFTLLCPFTLLSLHLSLCFLFSLHISPLSLFIPYSSLSSHPILSSSLPLLSFLSSPSPPIPCLSLCSFLFSVLSPFSLTLPYPFSLLSLSPPRPSLSLSLSLLPFTRISPCSLFISHISLFCLSSPSLPRPLPMSHNSQLALPGSLPRSVLTAAGFDP